MEQKISRRECENRILDKLLEIKAIYEEFNPNYTNNSHGCCVSVSKDIVSVFEPKLNAKGNIIHGSYTLNASVIFGERRYDM